MDSEFTWSWEDCLHWYVANASTFKHFFCPLGHHYGVLIAPPDKLSELSPHRALIYQCAATDHHEVDRHKHQAQGWNTAMAKQPLEGSLHSWHAPQNERSTKVMPDVDGLVEAVFRVGGREASRAVAADSWGKYRANMWRKALLAASHMVKQGRIYSIDGATWQIKE